MPLQLFMFALRDLQINFSEPPHIVIDLVSQFFEAAPVIETVAKLRNFLQYFEWKTDDVGELRKLFDKWALAYPHLYHLSCIKAYLPYIYIHMYFNLIDLIDTLDQ